MTIRKSRARVIISGKVQGVFFRAETQSEAIRLGVYGWVRNLGDGTVEAVFEGDEPSVDAMLAWCWKGSPYSSVAHVDIRREPYSGAFRGFDILR